MPNRIRRAALSKALVVTARRWAAVVAPEEADRLTPVVESLSQRCVGGVAMMPAGWSRPGAWHMSGQHFQMATSVCCQLQIRLLYLLCVTDVRSYLGPDYSDPEKRGVVGTITGERAGAGSWGPAAALHLTILPSFARLARHVRSLTRCPGAPPCTTASRRHPHGGAPVLPAVHGHHVPGAAREPPPEARRPHAVWPVPQGEGRAAQSVRHSTCLVPCAAAACWNASESAAMCASTAHARDASTLLDLSSTGHRAADGGGDPLLAHRDGSGMLSRSASSKQ